MDREKMSYGWTGTILRIDLSSRTITKTLLNDDLKNKYLGGRGINVRLLYDEVKPATKGLDPDNVLIFGTGPITGTMTASGRLTITAICPETNMLGDSNGGSHFSAEVKYAGYDHIIVTGKSEEPVYIFIDNDDVEIRNARHLWGKMTDETQEILKKEMGSPRVQVLCIGPAGEKLANIAGVTIGADGFGGRFGMGAVMGSKKLKALVVRGTGGIKVADPAGFKAWAKDIMIRTKQHPLYSEFSVQGQPYSLRTGHELGTIAYRNAQQTGHWSKGYETLGGPTLVKNYIVKKKACFGCMLHCRSFFEIKDGPWAGLKGVGVEFATQHAFGALIDNTSAPAMYKAFTLCNQYGLDQSQCGPLIAVATEWYEKGIIDRKDTEGLELAWGNEKTMIEMVHKIGRREGIGDLLAEGGVRAAKKIGNGAEECITHVKGIMRTSGDIRGMIAYALGLATATRGADHLRSSDRRHPWGQYEGAAEAVYGNQCINTIADALEMCKFHTTRKFLISLKDIEKLLLATTGLRVDEAELRQIGDRITNLERAMQVREGIGRKDDIFVGRYMNEPIHGGPYDGTRLDRERWDELLDEYYDLMGWDKKSGIPTRSKLEALGLRDVADDLDCLEKTPQIAEGSNFMK